MYVSRPHKKLQTIGGSREKCIDSKWSFGGSKMPIPLQKSRWVNAKNQKSWVAKLKSFLGHSCGTQVLLAHSPSLVRNCGWLL
jgi:hypothetical protein